MSIKTIFNQRNYVKYLFPITVVLLMSSIIYIFTVDPMPNGLNLCNNLKVIDGQKNITRHWWEWACLLEREWDKELEYKCKDRRHIANYYVCFDKLYEPLPPCLVYSFGIDGDFRFDDEMANIGCEVFSFDPSMNVQDHQRSERVRFLSIGIATEDSDSFTPLVDDYTQSSDKKWKIRTLASIKKMLGHENRSLDILKLDVESYEWSIIKQLLKDGNLRDVKQIAMEWHIFPSEPHHSEYQNMYKTYMDLKKAGFKSFYSRGGDRYHTSHYFNSQTDNSLVNTLFPENRKD